MLVAALAAASIILTPNASDQARLQTWANESRVPGAHIPVWVTGHSDSQGYDQTFPGHSRAIIAYDTATYIYDDPQYAYDQQDRVSGHLEFMHELGHVWDFAQRRHPYRAKFMRIMGYARGSTWYESLRPSPEGTYLLQPDEQFAMAYSFCAVYTTRPTWIMQHWYYGYFYNPTERQYEAACRLLHQRGAK